MLCKYLHRNKSPVFTDNSVGFHDQVFTSTAQRRLLADTGAFSTATKLYIRLHGAFMILAWIGAASIGIVMARYYKQTWIGSSLCSKDIWFAVSSKRKKKASLKSNPRLLD